MALNSQNDSSLDNKEIVELNQRAQNYAKKLTSVLVQTQNSIVGQKEILEKILVCMISDGHVLLEGAPGLAKTLMVKTLSDVSDLHFARIQFTPDLLPTDIIGTKIYKEHSGTFETQKGPIFHNLILADEINRAPPKVQSALLEAMQERQVSIHGDTFELDKPFLVLATQNPIEQEGTYRLPEAQTDRFAMKLLVNYPSKDEEAEIINRFTTQKTVQINQTITSQEILEIQKFNREIYADGVVIKYITDLVDATRNPQKYNLELDEMIFYGASPRASIWLTLTAKAHALINGRGYVIPEDIKAVVHDVLRHRIFLSFEAETNNLTTDKIIDFILEKIESP